jgi:hypothetical protein
MTTKRVQAPVLATAAVAGYAGDGLTRYVLTAASGAASPDLLATVAGISAVEAGERLVRSSRFSALRPTIWPMNCSSSCTGVVI